MCYVFQVENTFPSVFNFLCECDQIGTYASDVENSPGHEGYKNFWTAFSGGALESRVGSICGAL